jgi:hypothetical protein
MDVVAADHHHLLQHFGGRWGGGKGSGDLLWLFGGARFEALKAWKHPVVQSEKVDTDSLTNL